MRRVPELTIIASVVLTLGINAPAIADQNDPALVPLFSALGKTTRRDQAAQIQTEIWRLWMRFGDDQMIDADMRAGVQMMNEGDLVGANNRFTQMVVDAPLFAEAWNKRATVRFLLGDNAGSKSDIIKVIELEPRHFGALSGLGMIHLEEGNLQGAVQAYEAALAINPHMDNLRVIVERLNQQLNGQAL